MCKTASGNLSALITLKIKVTKDMSLRDLVNYGASRHFLKLQSLVNRKFKFVEGEFPQLVRTATGASLTVIERIEGILYTLKDIQLDY